MYFCSSPLKHERETVYDHFLTCMETKIIDDYVEYEGEFFVDFLAKQNVGITKSNKRLAGVK